MSDDEKNTTTPIDADTETTKSPTSSDTTKQTDVLPASDDVDLTKANAEDVLPTEVKDTQPSGDTSPANDAQPSSPPILKEEPKSEKKKAEIKLDVASLRSGLQKIAKQLLRYAAILFFLLVAVAYGFVILRINTLSSTEPSQSDIKAQTTSTPVPRIDPNVAKRLKNLEDNSQNVQTLFDDARKNPFD